MKNKALAGQYKSYVGQKIGMLQVQQETDRRTSRGGPYYVCLCDCGQTCLRGHSAFLQKRFSSCGCVKRPNNLHEGWIYVRGKKRFLYSAEKRVWGAIKNRCHNKNHSAYNRYGGRGITVSEAWLDFDVFYRDMGPRPSDDHSIERIDNQKGYSKDNCRWATRREQMANTSINVFVTFGNKTLHLCEWARFFDVPPKLFSNRHVLGARGDAIFAPYRKRQKGAALRIFTPPS